MVSSAKTVSPSGTRFPALDGLRALAALSVVFTHVGFNSGRSLQVDIFGPVLSRLDIGVTVFFLLSGFLLYRPFALAAITGAAHPPLFRFFWRRLLRIGPALWVMVSLTLLFITTFRVTGTNWFTYLSLIQTYNHNDYDPNLTQLWTLTVEVAFYAALPLIARLAAARTSGVDSAVRRQVVVLAGLAVGALAFNLLQAHRVVSNSQALLWFPAYLDWFALGMGLAVLTCIPNTCDIIQPVRRVLGEWADAPGLCALIAGLCFMLSTLPLGIPRTLAPATFWQWTLQHYLFSTCGFFLMLPMVLGHSEVLPRVLGSRVGRFGGNISYSVYLWHVPLMLWLQHRLHYSEFHGYFWELLAVTLLASIVVASASWLLIEQPILRYGSRPWTRALRAPTTVDPPIAVATTATTHKY
ncbi:MAG: acyltransferase family protein [Jatrophihabitans sp.]